MMQATDKFYIDLQQSIGKLPKHDMLMLMDDFNARINQQPIPPTFGIIGSYTVDVMNKNGERLVGFCAINNLDWEHFLPTQGHPLNYLETPRNQEVIFVRIHFDQL